MRMCGHAHHDDMLYLGKDPPPSWEYPPLVVRLRRPRALRVLVGARSDRTLRRRGWRPKGVIGAGDLDAMKREAEALVEREARAVIDAPWPDAEPRRHRRVRGRAAAHARRSARAGVAAADRPGPALPELEAGPAVRSARAARFSKA